MTDQAQRPRKQEQEPASEEIVELAPGVLRCQLPISMPGLGHVNCYLLEDERGVAVVDPGLPSKDSYVALEARLKAAGYPVSRVHTVIVTHSHPDHFGGAGWLRAQSGAEIVTHRKFRMMWDPTEPPDVDVDDMPSTMPPIDEAELPPDESFEHVRRFPWQTTPWGGPGVDIPLKRRVQMLGAFVLHRQAHRHEAFAVAAIPANSCLEVGGCVPVVGKLRGRAVLVGGHSPLVHATHAQTPGRLRHRTRGRLRDHR